MAEALTAARILEALDAEAARGDFPAFDNLNVDYISSRLTAYRGESEWAIVFNSIAWMDQSITTIVAPIGNCVEFTRTSEIAQKSLADSEEAGRYREALEATKGQSFFGALFTAFRATRAANEWMRTKGSEVLAEAERARQAAMASGVTEDHKFIGTGEIAIDYDDDGAQKVRSVSVRGRSIPLPTLTIEPKMHVHGDLGFWVAVALAQNHREALLAQPDEIARFFPRGLPRELLVLDDWRHVDVTGEARPSRSETFQMLANAIVAGDPSLYKPTERPNTHWSNWLSK